MNKDSTLAAKIAIALRREGLHLYRTKNPKRKFRAETVLALAAALNDIERVEKEDGAKS